MQIDADGKLRVLINGNQGNLTWPKDAPKKVPINQEMYPLVSFPKGMQGRVEMRGRSGIGLSLAEQDLRKKLQCKVFEAMAGGQCCAARLAFEAVQNKNPALLRTMSDHGIPINTQMSADNLLTPREAAVLSNNLPALHELLSDDGYEGGRGRRRRDTAEEAAPFPPNTISSEIDTGVVSARTFNHRVGTIGAARGGKEGNGAFITWS